MGRTSFPDGGQAAAFLQRVETPDFPISGPSGGSGSGSSSKSTFSHATAFRNRTPIYAIPVLPPVRPLQLSNPKTSDPTGSLPSYSISTIDRCANTHMDVKEKVQDLLIDR